MDGFTYAEVTDSSLNCTEVLGADYEDCSSYETGGLTYYYWYPDDDTVQYLYESYSSIVSPIEGVTNKHFMNWMRTAGVPEFRRLYGVFDTSVSAGDVIVFTVTNNFEVLTFGGSKSLVLTTHNAYGGQNYSIAYSYFAVGALALVVGIFLKWKRSVDPRPLGDIRVLYWT